MVRNGGKNITNRLASAARKTAQRLAQSIHKQKKNRKNKCGNEQMKWRLNWSASNRKCIGSQAPSNKHSAM